MYNLKYFVDIPTLPLTLATTPLPLASPTQIPDGDQLSTKEQDPVVDHGILTADPIPPAAEGMKGRMNNVNSDHVDSKYASFSYLVHSLASADSNSPATDGMIMHEPSFYRLYPF